MWISTLSKIFRFSHSKMYQRIILYINKYINLSSFDLLSPAVEGTGADGNCRPCCEDTAAHNHRVRA